MFFAWWDRPGPSPAEVEEKYLPRLEADPLTRCYLILLAEQPIGFIQEYVIGDHPDYARQVDVGEGAAGIDLFIGNPDLIHRGLGPCIIRRFLTDCVFNNPTIASCVIGPSTRNLAAIRAYEKAGFAYLKTVQVEGEEDPEYLMRLRREELL